MKTVGWNYLDIIINVLPSLWVLLYALRLSHACHRISYHIVIKMMSDLQNICPLNMTKGYCLHNVFIFKFSTRYSIQSWPSTRICRLPVTVNECSAPARQTCKYHTWLHYCPFHGPVTADTGCVSEYRLVATDSLWSAFQPQPHA